MQETKKDITFGHMTCHHHYVEDTLGVRMSINKMFTQVYGNASISVNVGERNSLG